ERFFQQRLYFAFGCHGIEDICVAVKLPVDEYLGKRRPVSHLDKRLPLGGLRQDVDEFIRIPVLVEKLHGLFREAAHRHLFGALAVDQNLMCRDFLVNFLLNGICHGRPPSFSAMNVERGTMYERPMSVCSVHRSAFIVLLACWLSVRAHESVHLSMDHPTPDRSDDADPADSSQRRLPRSPPL